MTRHPPQFGLFPSPEAADHRQVVELVLLAEELGLDLIGIQDHPYQRRFLDTFSLIADLLALAHRASRRSVGVVSVERRSAAHQGP